MTPLEFINNHLLPAYNANHIANGLPAAGGIHLGGLDGRHKLQVPGMPYLRQLIINPGFVYRVNYFFSQQLLDTLDNYIQHHYPNLNADYVAQNVVVLSNEHNICAKRGASGSVYIPGEYPFGDLQLLNANNANHVAQADNGAQLMVESFSTLFHFLYPNL